MANEEAIIRASAEACRQARLFGCSVEVEVRASFGQTMRVKITPHDDLGLIEELDLTGEDVNEAEDTTRVPST